MFMSNNGENRPLDIKGHRRLLESMKKYGFLESFPIIVYKDGKGNLVVKDGQHRLAIAELLALPVYWIEDTTNFDVAVINNTPKVWKLKDYAEKHAANGLKAYQDGLDFSKQYDIPIGKAFALLAGTVCFSNCENVFHEGSFKIKDRQWAEAVARTYSPLCKMSKAVANERMLEACMAVCRVPDFDPNRLIAGAERCREKLVSYNQKEAYLDLLETLYNFGRKHLVGLKAAATMAMRDRNAVYKSKSSASSKSKGAGSQASVN